MKKIPRGSTRRLFDSNWTRGVDCDHLAADEDSPWTRSKRGYHET
jgi:hypothetical protein